MAKNIGEIKNKQEQRRVKNAARERLTNWYMINMSWGFLGVILLQLVLNGYNRITFVPNTHILMIDFVLWIVAGLLFLGGAILFFLWFKGGRENSRFLNYSIFTWVCSLVALCISFYAQIRNTLIRMGIPMNIHSHWRVWFFMVLIGVWLIVALVIYFIKLRKL